MLGHAARCATVEAGKGAGADITVETCPHYLTFDAGDVDAVGPALKCAPPIRDGERERLWSDLQTSYFPDRSRVDYVASDHSPCTAALKRRGEGDIFEAWVACPDCRACCRSCSPKACMRGVLG